MLNTSTQELLRSIVDQFPRRRRELEDALQSMGIDEPQPFYCKPAGRVSQIATFAPGVKRDLSKMLRARYQAFSVIVQGPDHWIALEDIERAMHSDELSAFHAALRKNWDGSLPSHFSDEELSLFGYTPGVFDAAVYLAWPEGAEEPLVAAYADYESHEFSNLNEFLEWKLYRT